MDRPPCIKFSHCSFSYDSEPAVDDVSLAIQPGEFAAILGPNGSGKSTLIRLALGLIRPDRGTAELFGAVAHRFRDWRRVGYVPQIVEEFRSGYPATVEEVVSHGQYLGFSPWAVFRRGAHPQVLDAMKTAGVAPLARRRVTTLSVGQQQRVLIARALVRRPDLLILDEPMAGVDAAGQELFFELLRRLNADAGLTIVLVSHDIGAVIRQATMVACINRSVVFHGAPHELSAREISQLYGLPVDILLHDAMHEHR